MHNFSQILKFLDIIVMVILIIVIALQNKSSGLSTVFGGSGNIVQTRRGFEKWLFYGTVIFGIVFVAINISFLFFK
jgi:protein translocase SecG subunit